MRVTLTGADNHEIHQTQSIKQDAVRTFVDQPDGSGGGAEWSSTPARVQADYGNSVLSQVNNQIYNPDKAQHPAALLPDGMEGNKADSVLNTTYRGLIFVPKEELRHTTTYGQPGISNIGGTGGSTR